jgi:hypothetical protein
MKGLLAVASNNDYLSMDVGCNAESTISMNECADRSLATRAKDKRVRRHEDTNKRPTEDSYGAVTFRKQAG